MKKACTLLIVMLIPWIPNGALAETSAEGSVQATKPSPESAESMWNIRLGYFTWQERVQLKQGGLSDQALGNFFGNSLSLEHESYWNSHHGVAAEVFLMAGTAAAGSTQVNLPYSPGVLNRWSGGAASVRYAYLLSDAIVASLGPILLARSISWASDPSGTSASSESSTHLGLVADVRYRLTPSWEVRQLVGSLAQNLGILWTLSLGYQF